MNAEEDRLGWWSVAAALAILLLWSTMSESSGHYVLYSLPPLLMMLHAVLRRGRIELSVKPVWALGLYTLAAVASLAFNQRIAGLGERDILIIGSYILVFGFRYRAAPGTVDFILAGLFLCMLAEPKLEGIHLTVDLMGSTGIMESGFAFPIGVVVLYYVHARRWRAALLAAALLFVAFKRITLVGAIGAVVLDQGLGMLGWRGRARAIVATLVVALSLFALFSPALFEFIAREIGRESVSANSVSMGRFDFAIPLWNKLDQASPGQILFGFGPGAAEETIRASLEFGTNPHNDWLKIFFDYGAFGFVIMHVVLFLLFATDRLGLMIYLYTAFLFMSDNVLIYTYHQIVVMLVMRARHLAPSMVQHRRQTFRHPAALQSSA